MSNAGSHRLNAVTEQFNSSSANDPLPARLLPQDEELSRILHEMIEISRIAESSAPDPQVLSQTLRRAVSCVARQSLLEQELRSLALFDDLTGLHNRRAFWTLANQELRVAARNDQSFLLFFADIDGLKQINDELGHHEGDLAIIRTARALQRTFRNSDVIARLGGDEFAVIALDASNQQDESGILRRLAAHLQTLNADPPRYDLTLSVGIARHDPRNPASLSELMEQADRSMYQQKRKQPSLWATPPSVK
jgi:two-component system cell cycle response regulator